MGARSKHYSVTDCIAYLQSVLHCLDQASDGASPAQVEALLLAAAHVQQAIELVQAVDHPDA